MKTSITDIDNRIIQQQETIHDDIDKTVDAKDQIAFSEAVGRQQSTTIATDATIDEMKNDDYVEKLGNELLNNSHVLTALNFVVTNIQASIERLRSDMYDQLNQCMDRIDKNDDKDNNDNRNDDEYDDTDHKDT